MRPTQQTHCRKAAGSVGVVSRHLERSVLAQRHIHAALVLSCTRCQTWQRRCPCASGPPRSSCACATWRCRNATTCRPTHPAADHSADADVEREWLLSRVLCTAQGEVGSRVASPMRGTQGKLASGNRTARTIKHLPHLQNFAPVSVSLPVQCTVILSPALGFGPDPSFVTVFFTPIADDEMREAACPSVAQTQGRCGTPRSRSRTLTPLS